MKKTLLLAGVACVMMTAQAQAGNWYNNMVHNTKIYVGADYAFDSVDFKGALNEAKEDYNSGIFNIGSRMDNFGVEFFGQWSLGRSKDTAEGKLKTKINAYGMDMYGYLPLGCEGKYDVLATIGVADYYYKGFRGEANDSNNRIGWRVGGGAMYNYNEHVSARVIGRYAYIGDSNLNHVAEVTAGLRYHF